ncbi:sigma-54-dependent transcriptional regulator [Desulfobaculum bizertense]|uniref:Two-component system, NtrC family, response regulator n=1 Tax=Desulfobaculum bizertense DSM 18034 TaxID=1121442 RepID=A0A1T4WC12_9BACT|nr:sigma-54 dependent transcriptional regulator [Desulfobaculum bizertense]UIJ37444.1 sigma-54 dependent transcriptional regulator [Desulfobaculum bizertense]SKA74810.1 two-component system, NtrC family, response regulator [Desulfobaculum bizertense DSM 18034]
MNPQNVLILDDDGDMNYALCRVLQNAGYAAHAATTLGQGLEQVRKKNFDAVFLDVRLPDGNGLSIIPDIIGQPSHPEVIIITGNSDPDGAELAITSGAWDYIEKTDSMTEIIATLDRAMDYRRERLGTKKVRQVQSLRREHIVGESPQIVRTLERVAQCAPGDVSVLVTGETGTGKELCAKAIHNNSPQASGPFITVDCAALPEQIAESLLFGHARGTFTGAVRDTQGLLLQASGGTLFLDEVGELPLSVQKIFLRVLQERMVRPLGAKKEQPCDFRLVAATNRNLDEMISAGTFRPDLAFRIRGASVELPPLRNREGDVHLLVEHYMALVADRNGWDPKECGSDVIAALEEYDWPGNVRELVHAVEFAVTAARHESQIYLKHLPPELRAKIVRKRITPDAEKGGLPKNFEYVADDESIPTMQEHRNKVVSQAEQGYLKHLLASTGGSIKRSVELSGLSQSRFYALLKKYKIKS